MSRTRLSKIREILMGVDDIGYEFMKTKHPVSLGAGGGLGAASLVAGLGLPLVGGLYSDLSGETADQQDYTYETEREERLQDRLLRLEDERQQRSAKRNMARIAQSSPHLYQQIMSGRILPQGAVVLGGQPREDLLQDLAQYMGSLQSQDSLSLLQ